MPHSPDPPAGRVLGAARLGFAALGVAALIAGYVGLAAYLDSPQGTGFGRSRLDLLYYDLQLFVLDSGPVDHGGPYPWTLEFARFAAPATTIYALFEAARALLADELRRLRQRVARGHVVVTGDTPVATTITAALRAGGARVIHSTTGDARALRAAGLAGARALYACADDGGDGAANLATALAATTVRGRPALRIYAQVSDVRLGLALRARRLTLPATGDLRLDFFNAEELAARELIRAERLSAEPMLVVGGGTFAQALVVEYARQWRVRGALRSAPVSVSIVDPDADRVAHAIGVRSTIVAQVCVLTAVREPLESHLARVRGAAPYRVYLCDDDEERALHTALTVTRLWRGGAGSIVVRLNRLGHHGGAFRSGRDHLLDDLGGRLRLVSVTELACVPVMIEEDLVERLAQAIHENYLATHLRAGVPMGSSEAMRPWTADPVDRPDRAGVTGSELSADFKEANRDQARHIGTKLSRIGCTIAARTTMEAPFEFTDAELASLAELEHERWMAQRLAAGWVFDPVRDDRTKRHDCLVPWSVLPEAEREKDRDAVRALPVILAEAGLHIVRLDP